MTKTNCLNYLQKRQSRLFFQQEVKVARILSIFYFCFGTRTYPFKILINFFLVQVILDVAIRLVMRPFFYFLIGIQTELLELLIKILLFTLSKSELELELFKFLESSSDNSQSELKSLIKNFLLITVSGINLCFYFLPWLSSLFISFNVKKMFKKLTKGANSKLCQMRRLFGCIY